MGIQEIRLSDAMKQFATLNNESRHGYNSRNIFSNWAAFVFKGETPYEAFKGAGLCTRIAVFCGSLAGLIPMIGAIISSPSRVFTSGSPTYTVLRDEAVRNVALHSLNQRVTARKTTSDVLAANHVGLAATNSMQLFAKEVAKSFASVTLVQDIAVIVKAAFKESIENSTEYKMLSDVEKQAVKAAFFNEINKEIAEVVIEKFINDKNARELQTAFGKKTIETTLAEIHEYIYHTLNFAAPVGDHLVNVFRRSLANRGIEKNKEARRSLLEQWRVINQHTGSPMEINEDFVKELKSLQGSLRAKREDLAGLNNFKKLVGTDRKAIVAKIVTQLGVQGDPVSQDGLRPGFWLTKSDLEILVSKHQERLAHRIAKNKDKIESLNAQITELTVENTRESRTSASEKRQEVRNLVTETTNLEATARRDGRSFTTSFDKLDIFDSRNDFEANASQMFDLEKEIDILEEELQALTPGGALLRGEELKRVAKEKLTGRLTEVRLLLNRNPVVVESARTPRDHSPLQRIRRRGGRPFMDGSLLAGPVVPPPQAQVAAPAAQVAQVAAPVAPAVSFDDLTTITVNSLRHLTSSEFRDLYVQANAKLKIQKQAAQMAANGYILEHQVNEYINVERQYSNDAFDRHAAANDGTPFVAPALRDPGFLGFTLPDNDARIVDAPVVANLNTLVAPAVKISDFNARYRLGLGQHVSMAPNGQMVSVQTAPVDINPDLAWAEYTNVLNVLNETQNAYILVAHEALRRSGSDDARSDSSRVSVGSAGSAVPSVRSAAVSGAGSNRSISSAHARARAALLPV